LFLKLITSGLEVFLLGFEMELFIFSRQFKLGLIEVPIKIPLSNSFQIFLLLPKIAFQSFKRAYLFVKPIGLVLAIRKKGRG
jgi:hypothetical protein